MGSGSSRLFSEMGFGLGEFSRFSPSDYFSNLIKIFISAGKFFKAGLFFEIDYVTLITASGCMAIVVETEI